MKIRTGIIAACCVVVLGLLWLYLTMVGPLKTLNIGFNLTAGLSTLPLGIPGGYNMADVVMLVIFVAILVIGGLVFFRGKKTT